MEKHDRWLGNLQHPEVSSVIFTAPQLFASAQRFSQSCLAVEAVESSGAFVSAEHEQKGKTVILPDAKCLQAGQQIIFANARKQDSVLPMERVKGDMRKQHARVHFLC